ncbi:pantetheine-phosphate adenylyltransferase [Mycoplasmopsis columbinasalis]|uniref:Phosphopantetheine adenylyltransferase n=1 Tax=Mycoplasmopsis columbinasalis TaxID=114880 RepID=A0A449BAL8_9BACT|nr:pantetheine-phosphate adenylyltransferase [Mycoplasmopsis columbinasalis]VEU78243.1 pantetheine-phosphate adenylyltransferase [Mycoplasmopsis columbinasalis]
MPKIALFPGSFNPIHEGHYAIIDKALKLFDQVVVLVSFNPDKNNLDNLEERFATVQAKLTHYGDKVVVLQNKNQLTADVARNLGIEFILRSARNDTDYSYELELAAGNKAVNPNLETILIIPDYDSINYSSTLIRHKKKLGLL